MSFINLQSISEKRELAPHRICFALHSPLKRSNKPQYIGYLYFPFPETIKPIFGAEFPDFPLFKNSSSYHTHGIGRSVQSEEEYTLIEDWISLHNEKVFLRDCLPLSIALSMNFIDPKEYQYTEIGNLEFKAKRSKCERSIQQLINLATNTVRNLPFYKDADLITGVPPRDGKTFDLPSYLAQGIAKNLDIPDITSEFSKFSKPELKDLPFEKKWEAWEKTNLSISEDTVKDKNIILLDDLYQSGLTMQYVASRLYMAGAKSIYGLSITKSCRDSDNTQ
jgi:hypothetical protein